MNSTSRDRIFSRLYAAPRKSSNRISDKSRTMVLNLDSQKRIHRLKQLMEGMRAEVHVVNGDSWVDVFMGIIRKRGVSTLLYSPWTDIGTAIEMRWKTPDVENDKLPALIPYDGDIEDFKARLFEVEAAITTSKGAIMDTGAIILCPDEKEPRLMSLMPPIHAVVLDAQTIYNNLSEAMEKENWREKMPTNVILISGPSKTADIELTLAFGVHGPKEMIVLILTGDPKQGDSRF